MSGAAVASARSPRAAKGNDSERGRFRHRSSRAIRRRPDPVPNPRLPWFKYGTGTPRLSSPKSGNAGASPLLYIELLRDARTPLGEGRGSDFGELSRAARRGWAGEKSDLFNSLLDTCQVLSIMALLHVSDQNVLLILGLGLPFWLPTSLWAAANYEESLKQLAEGVIAGAVKAKKQRLAFLDFSDFKGVEDNREGLCTRGLELSPRRRECAVLPFTAPPDASASQFTLHYHEKSPRRDAAYTIDGLKVESGAVAVPVNP